MKKTVWVDANNSPHVLILTPVIRELEARGYRVLVTARDYSQTLPLMEKSGIAYKAIGKHGGGNTLSKAACMMQRILKLRSHLSTLGEIHASFCHGSRELIVTSKLMGIPSMVMFDYEYTEHFLKNRFATGLLVPSVITDSRLRELSYPLTRIHKYPGLKEELYLKRFSQPRIDSFRAEWIKNDRDILAVVRPPSTESHYHNSRSEMLLEGIFRKLNSKGITSIILPRYSSQIPVLKNLIKKTGTDGEFVFPESTLNGSLMISAADLCISGGGTMTREAAVMGTPAYTIFTGKLGCVDEYLNSQERLMLVSSMKCISNIKVQRKPSIAYNPRENLPDYIVDVFEANCLS